MAVPLWAVPKPYNRVRVRCPFHHDDDHVTGRAAVAWREVRTRLSRIEHLPMLNQCLHFSMLSRIPTERALQ